MVLIIAVFTAWVKVNLISDFLDLLARLGGYYEEHLAGRSGEKRLKVEDSHAR